MPRDSNAGLWAICASESHDDLIGAGVGVLDSSRGFLATKPQDEQARHCNSRRQTSRWENKACFCTVVDLRTWKIPEKPFHFPLCGEAFRPHFLYFSDKKRQFATYLGPRTYEWFQMERTMHGFDAGFKKAKELYESNRLYKRFWYGSSPQGDCRNRCGSMTWYSKSKGTVSVPFRRRWSQSTTHWGWFLSFSVRLAVLVVHSQFWHCCCSQLFKNKLITISLKSMMSAVCSSRRAQRRRTNPV